MSSATREISVEDGQPIRCYEFARGPLRWMYTTADRNVMIANRTFLNGYQISDSGIENSGQSSTDTLTVTIAGNSEVSNMYRNLAPSDAIDLTIWDYHYEESDYLVSWVGTVQNVKWPTIGTCEITCASLAASLERPGLTLGWQRACPYTLYDTECRVDEAQYQHVTTVMSASGIVAIVQSVAEFPDDWFSGGYLEWDIGSGVYERRGIRTHKGDKLVLLGGVMGLPVNQQISMYPGCYRTTATCAYKFDNIVNYGGIPHLPGRSPFDGNPVF